MIPSGTPGTQGMPMMSNTPVPSGMPDMSTTPGMPGTQGMPMMSNTPVPSGMPDMSTTPGMPGTQGMPMMSGTPVPSGMSVTGGTLKLDSTFPTGSYLTCMNTYTNSSPAPFSTPSSLVCSAVLNPNEPKKTVDCGTITDLSKSYTASLTTSSYLMGFQGYSCSISSL